METNLHQDIQNMLPAEFNALALRVYAWQREHCPIYRQYLDLTHQLNLSVRRWQDIPCMPINFFRLHEIKSGSWFAETQFESSGTSGAATSRHLIRNLSAYQQGCRRTFEQFFGKLSQYRLLALLPNYLERGQSGLVAMIDDFIKRAANGSGYFLYDHTALRKEITQSERPVLLWGVSFALLDLVEEAPVVLPQDSIVMETGGMKGRRKELTREELHSLLASRIQLGRTNSPAPIYSEYGMTELQSQAYFLQDQRFHCGTSMRVQCREVTDPFRLAKPGKTGVLNIYDLANESTCSFLQTEDLGRVYEDGSFDVLGRLDHSIVRGCSQLVPTA